MNGQFLQESMLSRYNYCGHVVYFIMANLTNETMQLQQTEHYW